MATRRQPATNAPDTSNLVALKGDPEAFRRAAESHRKELLLHCYRLVGSYHDAEDLVQETFLRAWKALDRFQGRSSIRSWLYRIATNVCLDALARRANTRRFLPQDLAGSTKELPTGQPSPEIPWIEPFPDVALDGAADDAPGPATRYEMREAVRLAFIAATQRLPARQRAALVLRDVLGWSGDETASALKISLPASNSALQRARGTLDQGLSREEISDMVEGDDSRDAIAAEYATAWEQMNLDGLVGLLTRDATLAMPPWTLWYSGRANVRALFVFAWKAFTNGGTFKMVASRANSQLAFGTYLKMPSENRYRAHVFQVLALRKKRIARLTLFIGNQYFAGFNLPLELK